MAEQEGRKAIYSVSRLGEAAQAVESARRTNKSWAERRRELRKSLTENLRKSGQKRDSVHADFSAWRRETYLLPRSEARAAAKQFLEKYPKSDYRSEVESWRALEDDMIEFTMRRLPSNFFSRYFK